MVHFTSLCLLTLFLFSGFTINAQQPPEQPALPITCEDESGNEVTLATGAHIIVEDMVSGLDYTATVMGIDDFNPIMAVVNGQGEIRCVDDARDTSDFTADLPTTNFIDSQSRNTQIRFNNGVNDDTGDVSIFISNIDEEPGAFLLTVEGMAVNEFDDAGDIFSIIMTEEIRAADVFPTIYAFSVTGRLDPTISLVSDTGEVLTDDTETEIFCDDSGIEEICWGENVTLDSFYVTRSFNRELRAREYDAMLTYQHPEDEEPDRERLSYLVGSYLGTSFGDYVVAFHITIEEVEE